MEPYRPWKEADREKILADVKSELSYREDLIPTIENMEQVDIASFDGYDEITYRYQTWAHFYSAATLYLPRTTKQVPLVFVCCGHGEEGRRTDCYAAMGHRLASLGIAAMVVDNIG